MMVRFIRPPSPFRSSTEYVFAPRLGAFLITDSSQGPRFWLWLVLKNGRCKTKCSWFWLVHGDVLITLFRCSYRFLQHVWTLACSSRNKLPPKRVMICWRAKPMRWRFVKCFIIVSRVDVTFLLPLGPLQRYLQGYLRHKSGHGWSVIECILQFNTSWIRCWKFSK